MASGLTQALWLEDSVVAGVACDHLLIATVADARRGGGGGMRSMGGAAFHSNGLSYYDCKGVRYEQVMRGTQVTYIVVN